MVLVGLNTSQFIVNMQKYENMFFFIFCEATTSKTFSYSFGLTTKKNAAYESLFNGFELWIGIAKGKVFFIETTFSSPLPPPSEISSAVEQNQVILVIGRLTNHKLSDSSASFIC